MTHQRLGRGGTRGDPSRQRIAHAHSATCSTHPIALQALSAKRIVEALAPLLSPADAAAAAAAVGLFTPVQGVPGGGAVGGRRAGGGEEPRLIRGEELQGGGGDQLMQLLWGGGAGDREAMGQGLGGQLAGGAGAAAGAGWEPLSVRAARMGDPWEWLAAVDAEDDRLEELPANPAERAASRHPAPWRPLRHGSKIRRRKLEKEISARGDDEDW